jgi:hypothetical protein
MKLLKIRRFLNFSLFKQLKYLLPVTKEMLNEIGETGAVRLVSLSPSKLFYIVIVMADACNLFR